MYTNDWYHRLCFLSMLHISHFNFVVVHVEQVQLDIGNGLNQLESLVNPWGSLSNDFSWTFALAPAEFYCKFPKYSDTPKICCNHSKIWTMWLYHSVMSPNDADGMANSVDPDQTAPIGAVWSGSALFAQAYLSENIGSLRYIRAGLLEIQDRCKWS